MDNLATHCMSLLNTTSLRAYKHPCPGNEGRNWEKQNKNQTGGKEKKNECKGWMME